MGRKCRSKAAARLLLIFVLAAFSIASARTPAPANASLANKNSRWSPADCALLTLEHADWIRPSPLQQCTAAYNEPISCPSVERHTCQRNKLRPKQTRPGHRSAFGCIGRD